LSWVAACRRLVAAGTSQTSPFVSLSYGCRVVFLTVYGRTLILKMSRSDFCLGSVSSSLVRCRFVLFNGTALIHIGSFLGILLFLQVHTHPSPLLRRFPNSMLRSHECTLTVVVYGVGGRVDDLFYFFFPLFVCSLAL
jgi:hypothetical protein